MRRWLWFNSLSLVMLTAFILFLVLQSIFGWQVHNLQQTMQTGAPPISVWQFLGSSPSEVPEGTAAFQACGRIRVGRADGPAKPGPW